MVSQPLFYFGTWSPIPDVTGLQLVDLPSLPSPSFSFSINIDQGNSSPLSSIFHLQFKVFVPSVRPFGPWALWQVEVSVRKILHRALLFLQIFRGKYGTERGIWKSFIGNLRWLELARLRVPVDLQAVMWHPPQREDSGLRRGVRLAQLHVLLEIFHNERGSPRINESVGSCWEHRKSKDLERWTCHSWEWDAVKGRDGREVENARFAVEDYKPALKCNT